MKKDVISKNLVFIRLKRQSASPKFANFFAQISAEVK
jgi:hypothetical protein